MAVFDISPINQMQPSGLHNVQCLQPPAEFLPRRFCSGRSGPLSQLSVCHALLSADRTTKPAALVLHSRFSDKDGGEISWRKECMSYGIEGTYQWCRFIYFWVGRRPPNPVFAPPPQCSEAGMQSWERFGRLQFRFRVKCSGGSGKMYRSQLQTLQTSQPWWESGFLFISRLHKLNFYLFRSRRCLIFHSSSSGSEQNNLRLRLCNPFKKSPVDPKSVKGS